MNAIYAKLVAILTRIFFKELSGSSQRGVYGSVFDLRDNVFITWVVKRAKRDPWTIAVVVIYLGVLYGVVGVLYTFFASAGWGGSRTREFLMAVHAISWGANAFIFMLYVPTRFAQLIATERERKTLDWLCMTPLRGWKLAIGCLGAAYAIPVALALTSIPHIVASMFSEIAGNENGIISAYSGLAASSILASTLAGVVAFLPKKAAQASAGAFIVVLGLNILGGMYRVPYFEALGCFGPWGGMVGPVDEAREPFVLTILGSDLPGIALQLPLCIALAAVFLRAIANKMDDERAGFFGAREGALATIILAIAALVSFSPVPPQGGGYYSYNNYDSLPGCVTGGRLLFLFLSMLPFAADSALLREDLVRGLARVPGDPPRPEEKLRLWQPAIVAISVLGLTGVGFALLQPDPARKSALVVAGFCAGTYLAVAALGFQAARLVFPNRVPNVIALAGLLISWTVPLLAAKIIHSAGAPRFFESVPLAFCPFITVFSAAAAMDRPFTPLTIDPVSSALMAILFNTVIATGLVVAIRGALSRATDFAETLVPLPADAFAAPGTVEKKCPAGHVYAATWDTCPHCA